MKNINFTDWQDLWLKKDVEGISKKMDKPPIFNLAVLINITIAVITLAVGVVSINNPEIDKKIMIFISIILVGVSILVPILYCVITYFFKILYDIKVIKTDSMDVKTYIDIFDNKICNRIMMANSLYENIIPENKPETNCYYICETSYYINMCIDEFIIMGSMIRQIFGNKIDKQVAPHRLILVINLIREIRKEIKNIILKYNLNNKVIDDINKENTKRDEKLNLFIISIKNIGIDIDL